MPKRTVSIPDVGDIDFPDSMSDLEVNMAADRLYKEAHPEPAKPFPLGGPLRLPLQPQEPSLRDVIAGTPSQIPGVLKDAATAALHTADSPSAEAVTGGIGGLLMGGSSLASAGKPLAGSLATRLYESALKPAPRSNTVEEVENMIRAGLEHEIPVSTTGYEKAKSLTEQLKNQVLNLISTQPQAAVNKYSVASRLTPTAQRFAVQVNPEADLAALSDVGQEFLRNQPANIPADAAQALKTGTYQQLKNRAYGELRGATVEGQKALARGLKEELESIYGPTLTELNQAQGDILNLMPDLQAAVNRSQNRNLIELGTPFLGGMVEAATGNPAAAAAAGAAREALGSPLVKSKLAIALAKRAR